MNGFIYTFSLFIISDYPRLKVEAPLWWVLLTIAIIMAIDYVAAYVGCGWSIYSLIMALIDYFRDGEDEEGNNGHNPYP